MNISIVIPAHNEEASIELTARRVLESVRTPFELIIVADHCTDRTEEIVQENLMRDPRVKLLRNDKRRGSFSNALITGYMAATGDAVVPVMADNCDDPSTIDRMWQAMQEKHADVVAASRYMKGGSKKGGPVLQDLLSRAVCFSLRILTRIPTWDAANSYKMYRTEFLRSLNYDIPNAGTEYSMALLFKAYFRGGKITEVPTGWQGEPIPAKDEWKILRRFPGYWFWYKKAVERKLYKQNAQAEDVS